MDNVQASLVNHLDSIQEERTWPSCGAILINSPTPGLHLKDGDVVGLPLSANEALRIRMLACLLLRVVPPITLTAWGAS